MVKIAICDDDAQAVARQEAIVRQSLQKAGIQCALTTYTQSGNLLADDMLPSKRTVKKALNAEKGAFCMSRKNKVSSELKKKVVRMCKSGQVSQAEAARRCGVSESTIKRWLSRERSEGCAGLESEATNRVYPSELKLQAVTAYLTGKYSQQEICEKFKIKSTRQLHAWLKVYNSGKGFTRKMSGGSRMKSTRKATQEERVQIARECLETGCNYGETAKKYGVSYQQVRSWTLKYKELGEAGLEDRRGKRKYEQEPRTELEKAQIEIAQLKHQLQMAQWENRLLKKLEEIERSDALDK